MICIPIGGDWMLRSDSYNFMPCRWSPCKSGSQEYLGQRGNWQPQSYHATLESCLHWLLRRRIEQQYSETFEDLIDAIGIALDETQKSIEIVGDVATVRPAQAAGHWIGGLPAKPGLYWLWQTAHGADFGKVVQTDGSLMLRTIDGRTGALDSFCKDYTHHLPAPVPLKGKSYPRR